MKTKNINFRHFQLKPFPHFDQRISLSNIVKGNLQTPSYISSHSFYPFIHYTKTTRKYKENAKLAPKNREIFYASHMDGYIFKYYGELLNQAYNHLCYARKIDEVSLAYRNNKDGKNNIDFAAEVVQFITSQERAYIFVSDFSSYFDSLDHTLLKKRLLTTLNTNKLSEDWWKVFRNITKYNWVEKDDVIKDLENVTSANSSRSLRDRYYKPSEFREFRKRVEIKKNLKDFGIPQGTAISAVLANVYAVDLDEALHDYANSLGGIYRRYSDDIIFVIPIKKGEENLTATHEQFIKQIVGDNKVVIGEGKTSSLYFIDQKIYEDNLFEKESKLDYLGFSFDGKKVKIREKSLYKYYHRTYKKIEKINKLSVKTGRKIGRKKMYSLYTHLGYNYKGHGNFISYSKRAHLVFKENDKIESLINVQTKRHWNKIQRRLIKIP
ncbi:reverse transcriptase domain-containing protein [Paenibacillus polymyxa]|uniref:reverse transcriptase domain-containing protein n=1 Tax=Paenibacillus polymyxa TaxID=1406 RepID=UPI0032AF8367